MKKDAVSSREGQHPFLLFRGQIPQTVFSGTLYLIFLYCNMDSAQ